MDNSITMMKAIMKDNVRILQEIVRTGNHNIKRELCIYTTEFGFEVSDGLGLHRNVYGKIEEKEKRDEPVCSARKIAVFFCRNSKELFVELIGSIPIDMKRNIENMTKFLTPYYIRTPDVQDKIEYIRSDVDRVKAYAYKLKNDCQWKGEVREDSENAAIHPRNKMVLFRRNRVLTRRLLRKQSKLNAQPIV